MNDPTRLIKSTVHSPTVTKVLSTITMGASAAYLLQSGNWFLITMAIGALLLIVIALFASSYQNAKDQKSHTPEPPTPDPHKQTWTAFNNFILTFIIIMFISFVL